MKIIEMRQPLDTITHLVIATGRSLKHLRKMSDSIVQAVSNLFPLSALSYRSPSRSISSYIHSFVVRTLIIFIVLFIIIFSDNVSNHLNINPVEI